MRILLFVGLLSVLGPQVWAEEHQRIAASAAVLHQWEVGIDGSVTPLGLSGWDLGWTARVGYEWEKTWSLGLSLPGNQREWGALALDLGWSGGSPDLRWNLDTGLEAEGGTLSAGVQLVRDPVILGLSAGGSWTKGVPEWGAFGSLSFQEVLNDTVTWSLALSPRVFWVESRPVWTLTAVWSVGWYEGPLGVSTGVSAGSLVPWSWSASAGWSWDVDG